MPQDLIRLHHVLHQRAYLQGREPRREGQRAYLSKREGGRDLQGRKARRDSERISEGRQGGRERQRAYLRGEARREGETASVS